LAVFEILLTGGHFDFGSFFAGYSCILTYWWILQSCQRLLRMWLCLLAHIGLLSDPKKRANICVDCLWRLLRFDLHIDN